MNEFPISLVPELSSLGVLEQSVADFSSTHDLDTEVQFRLNLMLDELITNSINYSLKAVANPELQLLLSLEGEFLVARIEDNGAAFNPFEEVPEPDTTAMLEDRQVGGLGVFLTKQLADDCIYERKNERNQITLRCNIGGKTHVGNT